VTPSLLIFIKGFLVSIGLVVAIGPQNAYLLRKGLKQRDVFVVATTCFLGDAFLLILAAGGVGALISQDGQLSYLLSWCGGLFLLWFGARSFRQMLKPSVISSDDVEQAGLAAQGKGTKAAIIMCLALTFLNPHVYVDTLVIIGGISSIYDGMDRWYFAAGAILASAVWFYGLGYGAKALQPIFQKKRAWQVLDGFVGIIMWSMAYYLLSIAVSGGDHSAHVAFGADLFQ
jgi:L-lysine exporter family protein LysE/ArgO